MAKGKGSKVVADVPVAFGGVSIGNGTARLSLRVERSHMSLETCDDVFCGHRLGGTLVLGRADDENEQPALFDDLHEKVKGTFDIKRVGLSPSQFSMGLTFSLADVDVRTLAKFSKGAGRLVVDSVSELPKETEHDDDDDASSDETPDTLKADGPWRAKPLGDLFDGSLLKSLLDAGLSTVGELSDYTASDKRLTDLKGIGEGKAAKIEDVMLDFWAANPDASRE